MTASPRVCPDAWTAAEDVYCELAVSHPVSSGAFVGRLLVVSSILVAGVFGAAVTWLLLKVTGWLQS